MGFGDFCSPSPRRPPLVIVLCGSAICRWLTGWGQRGMASPWHYFCPPPCFILSYISFSNPVRPFPSLNFPPPLPGTSSVSFPSLPFPASRLPPPGPGHPVLRLGTFATFISERLRRHLPMPRRTSMEQDTATSSCHSPLLFTMTHVVRSIGFVFRMSRLRERDGLSKVTSRLIIKYLVPAQI